ncbi:MAG: UDP-N-acetylmuramoyl-L-alanine--D-glutamate ligase [Candidatus Carbobacillus altaicus]|nr:UDP-N-acetylmuramoyl-L-alanine--D-glutamate ligase [Candidatus Carbobacillus altaicus]
MALWERGRETFATRRVFVLGAGKSGTAVARLLLKLGAHVYISEQKAQAAEWAYEMRALGAHVLFGQDDPDVLQALGIDLMVKNPGIPYRHPYVQRALKEHIPVLTEVEVAYRLWEGRIIAVTGSNGKTTTSYLIHAMLERAKLPTLLAGNVGTPLAGAIDKTHPDLISVLELSSFQLKGTETFRPDVAVWLNLYPHHLDYHETMEDYTASKARLFQHMRAHDTAVLNAEQSFFQDFARTLRSDVIWFSRDRSTWFKTSSLVCPGGKGTEGKGGKAIFTERIGGVHWAIFASPEGEWPVFPLHELSLPGVHNLHNTLAAAASVLALDRGEAAFRTALLNGIRETIRTFPGVPHRLEKVLEKDGIFYYNDAKATNPEATASALASFAQPVVWIAGGLERGESFDPLKDFLTHPVVHAVFYGQTRERLRRWAEENSSIPVDVTDQLEMAITRAHQAAQAIVRTRGTPVVVLFSPACASWDMFPSFEVRGDIFRVVVHTL